MIKGTKLISCMIAALVVTCAIVSTALAADDEIVTAYYRDKVYHGTVRQCQEAAVHDFGEVNGASIYSPCDYQYLPTTQKLYNFCLNDETWQYNWDCFGIDIPGLTPTPPGWTPSPTPTPTATPSLSVTPTATPTPKATATVTPVPSPSPSPTPTPAVTKYTVAFNSMGGSVVASRSVVKNAFVSTPANPARSGYTFEGWYRDSKYASKWTFASDKVTASITLYARWTATAPAAPTSARAASASYSSIKTTWKAVPYATGYQTYRASSRTGKYTLVSTSTVAVYTNTGLATGKTWYYKVRAYRMSGSSKLYGPYSAIVSAKAILSTPVAKAAAASATSVRVSWTVVLGASKYEVYRSTSKTGTYKLISTITGRSLNVTSLTTGRTWYFKARAYRLVSEVKIYSPYSPIAAVYLKRR